MTYNCKRRLCIYSLERERVVRLSMVLSKEAGVLWANGQYVGALSTGKQRNPKAQQERGRGCEEEAR